MELPKIPPGNRESEFATYTSREREREIAVAGSKRLTGYLPRR